MVMSVTTALGAVLIWILDAGSLSLDYSCAREAGDSDDTNVMCPSRGRSFGRSSVYIIHVR